MRLVTWAGRQGALWPCENDEATEKVTLQELA